VTPPEGDPGVTTPPTAAGDEGPLAVLRRIRRPPVRPRPGERCDLCDEVVPDDHSHLVDLESRRLLCVCGPCALLFAGEGAGGRRLRAVPDRYVELGAEGLSPAEWDGLEIPVSIAFLFVNSTLGRTIACYPGPAGATESMLPLGTWEDIVAAHGALDALEPDVEALLVHMDRACQESFVVPIDVCYELVGHLRTLWHGFDGGEPARRHLDGFFDVLRARATVRPVAGEGARRVGNG